MKLFISWSGMDSKKIAKSLKSTLADIFELESLEFFMSEEDILSGREWYKIIRDELRSSDCAILCITKENVNSSWINFEAGAIAMQDKLTSVIPLLIDADISLNDSPLNNYNFVRLTKDSFKKMIKDIKKIGGFNHPSEKIIDKLSDGFYDELTNKISDILKKIPEEYPVNSIVIYPPSIKLLKKNSIFIGAPMASIPENKYTEFRKEIINMKKIMIEKCGMTNIYYPGENISKPNDFDGEKKAITVNFKKLKESEYLIFIYPEKIASSILLEIGYGIALSKKIKLFIKDRKALPYILREADKALDNFKIYMYENYSDITNIICRNGRDFL